MSKLRCARGLPSSRPALGDCAFGRTGNRCFGRESKNGYYGVWTLRRAEAPTVVRAIRAEEARSDRDMDAWMRWFAEELSRSAASPLSSGRWHMTELAPRRASPERLVLFPVHRDDGLPSVALGLPSTLKRPRITYEDWGSNGSAGMLPFRDGSPPDAGRVKSWIKHAREGTLPPLLFWWVGGLDTHLLLDGHDRLAAALAVGIVPRVVSLWQSIDAHVETAPDVRARFIANYEALFDNQNVGLDARRQLNAKLVAQHRDTWRRVVTTARANPELDASWDEEVRSVAPAMLSDTEPDVEDLLFDG